MKKTLWLGGLGILTLAWLAQRGMLAALFSANYVPHRYCYLAQPGLVWTNVAMDGLIAASYAVIFGCLFWIAARLRGLAAMSSYLWIFIAFGTFIVACGATHMMEMVTIWWPVYPLSAAVKVICAAASVPTAILFARVSPALAANIRRFLDMLATTQQEKEQAVLALVASEKLAVAGRISTSIAHEIRNPLETVTGALYLLAQDERMPAELAVQVRTARAELDRAIAITQDTLAIFQGSGAPVPVPLGVLVERVLDLQRALLAGRQIELDLRLRTPLALRAYTSELRQILINLIQNAAAALGSGGGISVRVQPRHMLAGSTSTVRLGRSSPRGLSGRHGQPGYSITVADTGSGIASQHRSRLFTLFFTTKGEQGTGLGLWLVRSMVEKQGGRITFRSRIAAESPRHGTLFNVWIPLEPTELASQPASADLAWSAKLPGVAPPFPRPGRPEDRSTAASSRL